MFAVINPRRACAARVTVTVQHSDLIGDLTCSSLIDCLIQANSDSIFNSCMYMSNCTSLRSIVFYFNITLYLRVRCCCMYCSLYYCICPNGSLLNARGLQSKLLITPLSE